MVFLQRPVFDPADVVLRHFGRSEVVAACVPWRWRDLPRV